MRIVAPIFLLPLVSRKRRIGFFCGCHRFRPRGIWAKKSNLTKIPSPLWHGGAWGAGSTRERPGSDHVIWGPMRGLNKITWKGDRQIYKLTSRLYDRICLSKGRFFEKFGDLTLSNISPTNATSSFSTTSTSSIPSTNRRSTGIHPCIYSRLWLFQIWTAAFGTESESICLFRTCLRFRVQQKIVTLWVLSYVTIWVFELFIIWVL